MSAKPIDLSPILNPNEASRLSARAGESIHSFLENTNPEVFKKSGDLILFSSQATDVMRKILKANPHWDSIPNNPCPALKKQWSALNTQFNQLLPKEEDPGYVDAMTNPTGKAKGVADQMKAIEKKIEEFKCSLEKTHPQIAKLVRQWDCDKISEIKKRLGAAVQLQREYYDTTWIGCIAKFFLKLTAHWNNGDPAAIQSALVTLYSWDFEQPLHPLKYESFLLEPFKLGSNKYVKGSHIWNRKDSEKIGDVAWLRTSWIKKHLKTDHLYNEPLSKQIKIVDVSAVETA